MIKGVHIGKTGYEIVRIDGSLESLYQVCKCDCIDIVTLTINDHEYDIVHDSDGLFKDDAFCTVFSKKYGPSIVNDVFICSHDGSELASLTDDEIKTIKSRIGGHTILVD